jgi:hypothetical protein
MGTFSKPKPFLLICILPSLVFSSDWRNGDALFDARPIRAQTITLTWQAVSQVQQACESTSKQRGLGGFGYAVDACAFWHKDHCLIITGQQTSMHQLGHELRHCFTSSFH